MTSLSAGANRVRRALVVGGTAGIGEGIARSLAKTGNFHVTICGRSAERGAEVVTAMKALSNNNPSLKFDFIPCDCFRLSNIKALADDIVKKDEPLDVLVLSQGMATFQGYTATSEGLDQKLTLHYYGRFAFIEHLLPALRKGSDPKVMSVLSAGIHSPYSDFKTDFELKANYSTKNAADASCFYNDIALDSFSDDPLNKTIKFIHVAPGFVKSNWGTEMPFYIRYPLRLIQLLGRSIDATGDLLIAPLTVTGESSSGGLLLQNYTSGRGVTASKTNMHTADAKEFVVKRTREILARVLGESSGSAEAVVQSGGSSGGGRGM